MKRLHRSFTLSAATISLLILSSSARSEVIIEGAYSLYANVNGEQFEVGEYTPELINGLSGSGGKTLTVPVPGSFGIGANLTSKAEWKIENASFGLFAEAKAEATADWFDEETGRTKARPAVLTTASASWTDRLSLFSEGEIPSPLPEFVTLNYRLEGQIDASTFLDPQSPQALYDASADIFASIDYGQGTGSADFRFRPRFNNQNTSPTRTENFSFLLTLEAPLGPSGIVDINASFEGTVFTTYGTVTFDARNTMAFESVLLPDGRTPEEAGFNLVFESGLLSPNISTNVVPEPTSMALFGVGLCATGVLYRRKRTATA